MESEGPDLKIQFKNPTFNHFWIYLIHHPSKKAPSTLILPFLSEN